MQVDQLHPRFAARVRGIDLRTATDAEIDGLRATIDRYGVVVLPNQALGDEEQVAVTARLGPVQMIGSGRRKRLETPGITDISNLSEDDAILAREDPRALFNLANMLWHADQTFHTVPGRYSLLSCREPATTGGQTQFVDLRVAFEELPEDLRARARNAVAEHAFIHSRRVLGYDVDTPSVDTMEPVFHPVAHVHAGSERESLYLASHAFRIVGVPVPEGRMFLFELTERATQPELIFEHSWTRDDVVIWDNTATLHRGRPFPPDQRRDLRRVTTIDTSGRLIVDTRSLVTA
jgi:alpha-ketoglutarate-dependent 2,4-dichlorophenoxyacetate dioxygenase